MFSVGGQYLIEFLLEPLQGNLHQELSLNELLGGGILRDEIAHGGLQVPDGVKVLPGFMAVAGEERGDSGVGRLVRVPFGDDGASKVNVLVD